MWQRGRQVELPGPTRIVGADDNPLVEHREIHLLEIDNLRSDVSITTRRRLAVDRRSRTQAGSSSCVEQRDATGGTKPRSGRGIDEAVGDDDVIHVDLERIGGC